MNHQHWTELAEIYAAGALDGRELFEFERHLNTGCADCHKTIADTRWSLEKMGEACSPTVPPSAVKESLFSKLAAAPTPRQNQFRFPAATAIAACLILGVLAAPTILGTFRSGAKKTTVAAKAPVHDARMREILASPDTRIVRFKDPESGVISEAHLAWNPSKCAGCFWVKGLPKAAQGKTYELWGLAEGGATPAGIFTVDSDGQGHLDIRKLAEQKQFDGFAVSLEPAGGSARPTGPIRLVSL